MTQTMLVWNPNESLITPQITLAEANADVIGEQEQGVCGAPALWRGVLYRYALIKWQAYASGETIEDSGRQEDRFPRTVRQVA